jgi:hypothetical protein
MIAYSLLVDRASLTPILCHLPFHKNEGICGFPSVLWVYFLGYYSVTILNYVLPPSVGKQLTDGDNYTLGHHHLCIKVIIVELANKLTASATRWQKLAIPVDGNHLEYPVFAGGNHCCRSFLYPMPVKLPIFSSCVFLDIGRNAAEA